MKRSTPHDADVSGQQTLDAFQRQALCDAPFSSIAWQGSSPTLYLTTEQEGLDLGTLLGHTITLTLHEERVCTACGAKSETSPCPECRGTPPHTQCVYSPGNACTYQDCPFPEFREQNCSHDFEVYLVAKDRVKVGITRGGRRMNRFRDQGATHALILARAKNRKLAGIIEQCCTEAVTDRAPKGWFEPLENPRAALVEAARCCEDYIPDRVQSCSATTGVSDDQLADRVIDLEYPGCQQLDDAAAASRPLLDAGETKRGTLLAIRGGALALDTFTFESSHHKGRTLTIAVDDATRP
ncbi:Protein of unknown function [Natronobacterium gregoryi]|uniref:DUF2797 domain-containing protein n=2 Tax=Natronobacterium gregoryi TaxID=44930 RepID=L0AIN3_NATGS|nr:Protein of unknown function (DUF2797) [Natronobacterium gregoryi SP2]PLK19437.1 DUF2797 domain-containing protein [Natronobacterium gregoryi SP2]SFJ48196.1 Protein of unknown function [Natronobacterium gregoryi]